MAINNISELNSELNEITEGLDQDAAHADQLAADCDLHINRITAEMETLQTQLDQWKDSKEAAIGLRNELREL